MALGAMHVLNFAVVHGALSAVLSTARAHVLLASQAPNVRKLVLLELTESTAPIPYVVQLFSMNHSADV